MAVIEDPRMHAQGYLHLRGVGWAARAERDAWAIARELVGDTLVLVETHPIIPRPQGRSFAASKRETPLHTDSQRHRGVPPHLQVLLCVQPAARGGESLLLDTWALLVELARTDPWLHRELLERPRRLPFVFGDVIGPTVALRGHALVFSHPPMPIPPEWADPLDARLRMRIDDAAKTTLALAAGDALIVDNHRMLHGRRAFEDDRRRLLRLLIWTDARSRAPSELLDHARAVRERNRALLADADVELREAIIGPDPEPRELGFELRLELALALLRGESPGRLAAQYDVPEPELYRWRDAVLRGARTSLAALDDPSSHDAALERLRALMQRG